MNIVIVGTQWGDEGKGKVIDILSEQVDYIARYQGGSNAGHTVVAGKKEYIFHLIPSGILHAGKICCIGNGVVVDPEQLLQEIRGLGLAGIRIDRRLKISHLAHVILPYHKVLDRLRETRRSNKIGTTGRGIGPCYADKVIRCGIRMVDLMNPAVLREKLRDNLKEKNEVFRKVYGQAPFSFGKIYAEYLGYGKALAPFVTDVAALLDEARRQKKDILFEGAQGTFLDIDFGTYPFVTSSSATSGGACIGTGVAPVHIDKVIGVTKAYATRVGEGPFPTEFAERFGQFMREKGKEFGATTGRPRRCGWFDAVLVREAVLINGITELSVMKLDVLDGLKHVDICTAYRYKGREFETFPHDLEVLKGAKPVYRRMRGWQEITSGVRQLSRLPRRAREYIAALGDMLGARITMVSVGSSREETICI